MNAAPPLIQQSLEHVLEPLLALLPDLVVLVDPAGRITLFNQACETLTGYRREEALGRKLMDFLIPQEWASCVQQGLSDPFAQTSAQPHEIPWRTKSGEQRLIGWRCTALQAAQDEAPSILGIGTDLTKRVRTERDLQEALRQLVDIQERERRRIARELHDEIGQGLTVLKLALESCLGEPGSTANPRLKDALATAGDLLQGVRRIALDLRPPMLDDLGMLAALLWLSERCREQAGLDVNFRHSGLETRLPQDVETAIFRIAQEALTNIMRHAGVTRADVAVWLAQDSIVLRIADKGRGFDPSGVRRHGRGVGLLGMQERAALLGGTLTIDTGLGIGATITAELPRVHGAACG